MRSIRFQIVVGIILIPGYLLAQTTISYKRITSADLPEDYHAATISTKLDEITTEKNLDNETKLQKTKKKILVSNVKIFDKNEKESTKLDVIKIKDVNLIENKTEEIEGRSYRVTLKPKIILRPNVTNRRYGSTEIRKNISNSLVPDEISELVNRNPVQNTIRFDNTEYYGPTGQTDWVPVVNDKKQSSRKPVKAYSQESKENLYQSITEISPVTERRTESNNIRLPSVTKEDYINSLIKSNKDTGYTGFIPLFTTQESFIPIIPSTTTESNNVYEIVKNRTRGSVKWSDLKKPNFENLQQKTHLNTVPVDMELPPTSVSWALASLGPSSNGRYTRKPVNETKNDTILEKNPKVEESNIENILMEMDKNITENKALVQSEGPKKIAIPIQKDREEDSKTNEVVTTVKPEVPDMTINPVETVTTKKVAEEYDELDMTTMHFEILKVTTESTKLNSTLNNRLEKSTSIDLEETTTEPVTQQSVEPKYDNFQPTERISNDDEETRTEVETSELKVAEVSSIIESENKNKVENTSEKINLTEKVENKTEKAVEDVSSELRVESATESTNTTRTSARSSSATISAEITTETRDNETTPVVITSTQSSAITTTTSTTTTTTNIPIISEQSTNSNIIIPIVHIQNTTEVNFNFTTTTTSTSPLPSSSSSSSSITVKPITTMSVKTSPTTTPKLNMTTQAPVDTSTMVEFVTVTVKEVDLKLVEAYLRLLVESSWSDLCKVRNDLEDVILHMLREGTQSNVTYENIGFLNLDHDTCATMTQQANAEEVQQIPVMLYLMNKNGSFDKNLSEAFLTIWSRDGLDFPLNIRKVDFVTPLEDDSPGTSPEGMPSSVIAAIVISCIAGVCFILLGILLFIMKRRQKKFNYGQRCRPVSLDAYSLDSVSIHNSVRRKGIRASKRSYGNPAFDDPNIPSHPMNFAGLANFSADKEQLYEEFTMIPQISPKPDELPPGAETKNRYANVIPLPETRVVLSKKNGDPLSEYINANYVRGPNRTSRLYIASQAPMDTTVEDFWRMIWENQSRVVIMLTDLQENGVEKCTNYLPPNEVTDSLRLFGDFQVTLKKRDVKEKYVISSLQLKNMETSLWREVIHLWYLGWPETGVPTEENSLIAFLIEARSHIKTNNSGESPTVVHCSPGTGRTGTVIACDLCIREFEQTRMVDIPKCVYNLRSDRAGCVQTKDQYAFIYQVLNLYATKLTGGNLESI